MRSPNPPGYTPHCGQPGRHHPAGCDLSTGGHIDRGASTRNHDGASCGAEVEYRTSSTPAYTDELDLHHSTNNAPTKPRGRPRLRIADNKSRPHDWCAPTNYRSGPHSALRTTTPAPIIGGRPRIVRIDTTPPSPEKPPGETQTGRRFVQKRHGIGLVNPSCRRSELGQGGGRRRWREPDVPGCSAFL